MEELVVLAAVVLSLSIPIVAILWNVREKTTRNKLEKELRDHIIDNNVDMNMARLLISKSQPKNTNNKVTVLRWGLALIGLGLGILLSNSIPAVNVDKDFIMLCMPALGVGASLFLSFIIEMLLDKKLNPRKEEAQDQTLEDNIQN